MTTTTFLPDEAARRTGASRQAIALSDRLGLSLADSAIGSIAAASGPRRLSAGDYLGHVGLGVGLEPIARRRRCGARAVARGIARIEDFRDQPRIDMALALVESGLVALRSSLDRLS